MGGGGDMANVKNSNLKVPPLKIVLSSATSGGSDRSSSTSPSSESESLDSNLTIISDNQHDKSNASKSDQKEETVQNKQERASRHTVKGSTADKSSTNATASSNKRSYENNGSEPNNSDQAASREQTSSSNQRITRSSQRAAQQNKSENLNETNGDETNAPETQERTAESARKVKRRKGEPQESEQDNNQQVPPPPPVMANICPADYELPLQNSFELYRDIRKRPYEKLMKLTNIQPKVPHGFKDYLLNGGPYLLDGNRIGVGIKGGASVDSTDPQNTSRMPDRIPPKLYLNANIRPVSSQQLRHHYNIPKLLEVPENLKNGSPLHELFRDQEKSRQKMRMQHLKERERSIMTAEQEILRAYNKAAIVDSKQGLTLSACTYLYLQERYHYIDEKNDKIDCVNPKDQIKTAQQSRGEEQADNGAASHPSSSDNGSQKSTAAKTSTGLSSTINAVDDDGESIVKEQADDRETDSTNDTKASHKRKRTSECQNEANKSNTTDSEEGLGDRSDTNRKTCDSSANVPSKSDANQSVKKKLDSELGDDVGEAEACGQASTGESDRTVDEPEIGTQVSVTDQLMLNRSSFLNDLQEIDEKWARIRNEMLIRHNNEADSLYAVQKLDWEWKAKEIGECDVRVALKIEPKFVPRVEVSALDY